MYFFMYRTTHPTRPTHIFTFSTCGTCEGDVEWVEVPGEGCDELNSRKDAHPTQETDGAEEFPGAWRVGEQLAQQHANGCVYHYMDVLHRLNMQEMRGQSRGM